LSWALRNPAERKFGGIFYPIAARMFVSGEWAASHRRVTSGGQTISDNGNS